MKKKDDKNIFRFLKSFYSDDIYFISKLYQREQISSFIHIVCRYIVVIVLGDIISNAQNLYEADANFKFLKFHHLYEYLSTQEYQETIIFILFLINATIFGLFIILILSNSLEYFFSMETSTQGAFQFFKMGQKSPNSNYFFLQIKKLFSLLVSLFGYTLLIPSIYFSFKDLNSIYSIVNLLIAIFLGILFSDTDYNYQLNTRDYLATPYGSFSFSFFIIETVFAITLNYVENAKEEIVLIFLVLELLRLFIRPYYQQNSQKLAIFLSLYIFSFNITILISRSQKEKQTLISFLSCILLPLTYLATHKTILYFNNKLIQDIQNAFQQQELDMYKLDRIMRLPLFREMNDSTLTILRKDSMMVNQMNIIINKLNKQSSQNQYNNQIIDEQFQSQLDTYYREINSDEIYSQKNIKQIQKLLKIAFKDLFKSAVKSKKGSINEREEVVYFVFLIEFMGSIKEYWIQYKLMKVNRILSLKQQQIYNSIHKTIFQNKADILQKINKIDNPFGQEYVKVLQYENQLDQTANLFDQVIRQKVEVLLKMKQKLIVLEELIKDIDKFLNQNEKLKLSLNQLGRVYSENNRLYELQHLYLQILAFSEKDITIPKYGTSVGGERSLNQNYRLQLLIQQQQKELFNKYTCIVAAQYEDSGNLTIKHVSKNFYDIFYTIKSKQDIINKKIEQIIPTYLHNTHPKYVNRFLEKKQSKNNQTESQMSQLVFGSLSKFLIVPLQIKVKINSFLQQSEFGLTAKIKLLNQKKHYIVISPSSFTIQGVTPKIFQLLFTSKDNILKTNIKSHFPILQATGLIEINQPTSSLQINLDIPSYFQQDQQNENIEISRLNGQPPNLSPENTQKAKLETGGSTDFLYIKKLNSKEDMNYVKQTHNSNSKREQKIIDTNQSFSRNDNNLQQDYLFLLMRLTNSKLNYTLDQNYSLLEIVSIKQLRLIDNHSLILNHIRNQLTFYRQQQQISKLDYSPQISIKRLEILQQEIKVEYANNQILNHSISSNISQYPQSNTNQDNSRYISDNPKQFQENYNQFLSPSQITPSCGYIQSLMNLNNINDNQEEKLQKLNMLLLQDEKDGNRTIFDNQQENNHLYKDLITNDTNKLIQTANTLDQNYYPQSTRRGLIDKIDENQSHTIEHELNTHISPQLGFIPRDKSDTLSELFQMIEKRGVGTDSSPKTHYYDSYNNLKMGDNNNHIDQFKQVQSELNNQNLGDPQFPYQTANQNLNQSERSRKQQSQLSLFAERKEVEIIVKPLNHNKIFNKLELIKDEVCNSVQTSTNTNQQNINANRLLQQGNLRIKSISQQQKFFSQQTTISDSRNQNIEQIMNLQKFNFNKNSDFSRCFSPKENFDLKDQDILTNRKNKEILKMILEKQADIVSTSSKKSTYAAAKRQLRHILSDKHIPFVIKLSTTVGLISYFIMIALIMIQYFKLSDQIWVSKNDKFFSAWPVDFQASVYSLVKDNNILFALTNKNDYKFPSTSVKNAFMNRTRNDLFNQKDVVIDLIAQTSGQHANSLTFQLLKEYPNTFQFGQYYNPANISKASSIPAKQIFYFVNYTTTIHFSIILSYQHTYRYAVGLGTGRPEYYMILNNINFYSSLNYVQKQLLSIQKSRDEDLQTELVQVMVLIIGISAICVGIIIPLHSFVQRQREDIVTLFSTFNSNKIDDILENLQNDYEHQRKQYGLPTFKFTSTKISDNKKNAKNISTTTKLNRINGTIIIKLVIIFGLISVYPIVNKIITQEYLEQQTIALRTVCKIILIVYHSILILYQYIFINNNLKIIENMYKLKGYLASNIALHYNNIYMKMYPNAKPIYVDNFLKDIKNLLDQEDQQQQDLQNILQEQGSIKRQSLINFLINPIQFMFYIFSYRYRQGDYDDFFFSIIKSDICGVFQKYPQYISNSTIIDLNMCGSLYKGMLKKGFQLALKEYLAVFPNLYNIYLMQNATQYNKILQDFTATFDIQDFTLFEEFLEETLVSLKNFIYMVCQEQYDKIVYIQIGLFIYQILLMTIIFIFGWVKFCLSLHKSLLTTKKYLKVIDITTLLENSYILTFIKKNKTI